MKTIEILSGIPTSGKSRYTKQYKDNKGVVIISRDDIRDAHFVYPYRHSNYNEKRVTEIFNEQLENSIKNKFINKIILDNTFCKEKYLNEVIRKYENIFVDDYRIKIQITFFKISLLRAHFRNIGRYFKTGKWIPFSVMNIMYKNFNKMDLQKYKNYERK